MKKNYPLLIIGILILQTIITNKVYSQIINFAKFQNHPDATRDVSEALEYCRSQKATKLVFPKGEYHFYPDFAAEKYVFVSNNDEGLKRIAFDLSGMSEFEIDGQGSTFIFHGFVCPFLVEKATNIQFRNLSIDFQRTFHSEGIIMATYQDSLDVWFSPAFPYKVNNYRLEFTDASGLVPYPFKHILEFDKVRRETAFPARDFYYADNIISKDLGNGTVRLFLKDITGKVGNTLTFNAQKRMIPAFTVSKSRNILFEKVNIYHSGGMGVIAQQSADITLRSVRVTPSPGKNRMISLTADATHFVNCSGTILMEDCLFENQLDDATNVHGIYVRIEEILSPDEIIVKLVHHQQYGFDFIEPGLKVELADRTTLMPADFNTVTEVKKINKEYSRVRLQNALSNKIVKGDLLSAANTYPVTILRGCTIRNNRARGVLLGSRAQMRIENNYFHTQGPAILLEGDGNKWFEQSGVRDLQIRNNVFDNCNYNQWGTGVMNVMSGIQKRDQSTYNQNILVENNNFILNAPTILNLFSIDGLIFRSNTITMDSVSYKVQPKTKDRFVIKNSINIKIEE